jgi:acyl carrier protein
MNLKSRIKRMLVERLFLNVESEQIKDDANLMEAYDIDSVALFEIVVGLEDEFGISMEEDEFNVDAFRTVNAIAAYVASKQD